MGSRMVNAFLVYIARKCINMNYIFTCLFKKKYYEIYTSLVVNWLVALSCYKQKKHIFCYVFSLYFFKLCSKLFLSPVQVP